MAEQIESGRRDVGRAVGPAVPHQHWPGSFICDYLEEQGPSFMPVIHKAFKAQIPEGYRKPTYSSFKRYTYLLRDLGMIEQILEERGPSRIPHAQELAGEPSDRIRWHLTTEGRATGSGAPEFTNPWLAWRQMRMEQTGRTFRTRTGWDEGERAGYKLKVSLRIRLSRQKRAMLQRVYREEHRERGGLD